MPKSAPSWRPTRADVAELFISRRAEEELRQIWRYVAAENPAAADQLLLRIDEKLQFLRDFPTVVDGRRDLSDLF